MNARSILAAAACAVAAGAVPALGASLKAPVVREDFTPLPCTHNHSTADDMGCAEQRVVASDKKINALNKSIFARFDTASRRDFVAGHKAWMSYRRAYCRAQSDVFRGGSEAGVLAAECLAHLNDQHLSNLRGLNSDLAPK